MSNAIVPAGGPPIVENYADTAEPGAVTSIPSQPSFAPSRYAPFASTEERGTSAVDDFLDSIKAQGQRTGFPSFIVSLRAENLWMAVQESYGVELPVPLVALSAEGGVLFSWRKGNHYLEIELLSDASELFYENEEAGVVEDVDLIPGQEVELAHEWFALLSRPL